MSDTLTSLRLLTRMGRRAGRSRVVTAIGAAVVAGVAAVAVSLWLKLILDGVSRGDSGLVTSAAAALGVTATLQIATSSLAHLRLAELHMACGKIPRPRPHRGGRLTAGDRALRAPRLRRSHCPAQTRHKPPVGLRARAW